MAVVVIYLIASAVRVLACSFSESDSHGAGTQYPGGCPAFSSGMDVQTGVFVGGGLGILLVLQLGFVLLRTGGTFRPLILLLYALLLLVGPLFLLVPCPKV